MRDWPTRITARELSKILRISFDAANELYKGKRTWDDAQLDKLQKYFGVRLQLLR
jgi:plasmid maintenance system antidote protein VapI